MDIYGFRPLEAPWRLLSAFEFLMFWRAEALVPPCEYERLGETKRTKWTDAGKKLQKENKKLGKKQAAQAKPYKPGEHYQVLVKASAPYHAFPEFPDSVFSKFRHAWVLVRNETPFVPVLEGCPLPNPGRKAEANAKYCSVFPAVDHVFLL